VLSAFGEIKRIASNAHQLEIPVLNLKTDKALGLTFLVTQIARVDEVIE
jgi:hypothetical protein